MKKLFIILFLFVCLSANAVEKKTNFSEEIFENAKASGKTVVVNSYEVWCGTCSKQTNKNTVINNFFITCYNIFLLFLIAPIEMQQ